MAAPRVKPWSPSAEAPDLLLVNFTLVSPALGRNFPKASMSLSGGVVRAISTDPNRQIQPSTLPSATTLDLKGRWVCPGLIDCHVHMTTTPGGFAFRDLFNIHPNMLAYRTTYVAQQMLLRGFTTARDCGGADASLRDAIAEGLIPGPRLFIAGKALSQTGGHGDFRAQHQSSSSDVTYQCCGGHQPGIGRVCDGVPACLQAARDELRQGADFLKVMCGGGMASPADPLHMVQFTAAEIRAIVQTAGFMGTYVTAHAYYPQSIRHAVDNGVLGIEHANYIDADTAKLCAERGVFITPTLVTYRTALRAPFDGFYGEQQKEKAKQILSVGLESLKTCEQNGVTICFGTDLLGGRKFWQNEEFAVRAEVQSPVDILRSATTNAAKLLRRECQLGELKPGASADLLVLSADPLQDITVLDRVDQTLLAVMKEGRTVSSRVDGLHVDPLYQPRLTEHPRANF